MIIDWSGLLLFTGGAKAFSWDALGVQISTPIGVPIIHGGGVYLTGPYGGGVYTTQIHSDGVYLSGVRK